MVAFGSVPALELKNLTRRYGGLAAVDNVSFSLAQGEVLGLIGPNGAGKTTIINLITGATPPTSGDVLFSGKSLKGLAPYQRGRLGIARTFQVVQPLLGMTVLENVMVGGLFGADGRQRDLDHARREGQQALQVVGLAEKSQWPVEELTLADRKALELGRALASGPRVLLLDEVMAGLNHAEIDQKIQVLRRLNQSGLSILVIEHVMKVVMSLSTTVVVLHHGRKIADGPPEEVARDPEVITAYLGQRYAQQGAD